MFKDRLGREIVQWDVLAYAEITYGGHDFPRRELMLARVIDGCSFALQLVPYPEATGTEPWVTTHTEHMVIVKRGKE